MQIFIHCKTTLHVSGVTAPETCRVVLQWINICILLHLLDFLFTLNCNFVMDYLICLCFNKDCFSFRQITYLWGTWHWITRWYYGSLALHTNVSTYLSELTWRPSLWKEAWSKKDARNFFKPGTRLDRRLSAKDGSSVKVCMKCPSRKTCVQNCEIMWEIWKHWWSMKDA